jgi:hypothetical protein
LTGPLAGILGGPAPPAPPRRSDLGRNLLTTLGLALILGLAARVIELRPLELVRDVGNIGVFLKGYLHPSFTHIGEYAWQCVVTVCIALWGTLLAFVISVPLGLLGARNLSPHPVVYFAARRTMDVLRAVNEFVFALMFVTAVGLGPFAGMLALGIHTGGVAGAAQLPLVRAPALRIRHPLGGGDRHGRGRGHRLLPLGHDPLLQGRGGGDGHSVDRRHGDVHRRDLLPHPAGGDLARRAR